MPEMSWKNLTLRCAHSVRMFPARLGPYAFSCQQREESRRRDCGDSPVRLFSREFKATCAPELGCSFDRRKKHPIRRCEKASGWGVACPCRSRCDRFQRYRMTTQRSSVLRQMLSYGTQLLSCGGVIVAISALISLAIWFDQEASHVEPEHVPVGAAA